MVRISALFMAALGFSQATKLKPSVEVTSGETTIVFQASNVKVIHDADGDGVHDHEVNIGALATKANSATDLDAYKPHPEPMPIWPFPPTDDCHCANWGKYLPCPCTLPTFPTFRQAITVDDVYGTPQLDIAELNKEQQVQFRYNIAGLNKSLEEGYKMAVAIKYEERFMDDVNDLAFFNSGVQDYISFKPHPDDDEPGRILPFPWGWPWGPFPWGPWLKSLIFQIIPLPGNNNLPIQVRKKRYCEVSQQYIQNYTVALKVEANHYDCKDCVEQIHMLQRLEREQQEICPPLPKPVPHPEVPTPFPGPCPPRPFDGNHDVVKTPRDIVPRPGSGNGGLAQKASIIGKIIKTAYYLIRIYETWNTR